MIAVSNLAIGRGHVARLLALLGLITALVWSGAVPARADPPDNDTIEGSISVDVPFWGEQDTSEATTDELDASLNEECGAPATEASVWYQITPEEDLGVEVFVGESTYTAGVIVAADHEGELHVETCGPESVFFLASTGVNYQIMVFDDQPGGGNGGDLIIHIEGEPVGPPPELDLTIDPIASFHKDGTAEVSGTLTCTGSADFIEVFGELEQQVGRFVISGFFGLFGFEEENGEGPELTCDGTTQEWSATVQDGNGLFKGGKATINVEAFACGFFECSDVSLSETVRLRRAR